MDIIASLSHPPRLTDGNWEKLNFYSIEKKTGVKRGLILITALPVVVTKSKDNDAILFLQSRN